MPPWDTGELPEAPHLTLRSWALLVGPGLVAAGAAIGGGEWLAGPLTTARYGGAILWLATISILAQVLLQPGNLPLHALLRRTDFHRQVSPHCRGRCFGWRRTSLLDFGSVFPYLVANAATPLAAVDCGRNPRRHKNLPVARHRASQGDAMLRIFTYVVFVMALVPLVFGGKVYNSLKAVMSFKIVVVFGFLVLVAFLYSSPHTWVDIVSGFFKFGSIPVMGRDPKVPQVDNVFLGLVAWPLARPSSISA